MILYGLKTCDTCRMAARALPAAQLIDVRADGVPGPVLAAALERFGAGLVNSRSTTWRGLPQAEREAAPLDLLQRYPTLMKRPLIVAGEAMYLGWARDVQQALSEG